MAYVIVIHGCEGFAWNIHPKPEGVYFRQIPSSHGITDIFHLDDSTPSEKLLPDFGSVFILDFENFDCGTLKGISYSDIFDEW